MQAECVKVNSMKVLGSALGLCKVKNSLCRCLVLLVLYDFASQMEAMSDSNWSTCTRTCGFGTQYSRQCKRFETGECLITHRGCNRQTCPDDIAWGICSVSCGRGIQKGFKPDGTNALRICYYPPCAIDLVWSNCTKSCGNGTRYKFARPSCIDPYNIFCRRKYELCNVEPCPRKVCLKGQSRRYGRNDACCEARAKVKRKKKRRKRNTRWPWMVVISSRAGTCDGSLIHHQWVLTAAHCVMERKSTARKLFVHVGVVDWRNPGYYDRHFVTRVVPHPKYTNYQEDDVALLKLDRPVKASMNMKYIGLPHGEETPTGSYCFNTGWHKTTIEKRRREDMSEGPMQIFDLNACMAAYGNVLPHNKTLCYGSTSQDKENCRGGYSGSAIVCQRCASCRFYIAGVHSFSSSIQNCPDLKKPRGAVKLIEYEEWILRNVPVVSKINDGMTGCSFVKSL